MEGIRRCRREKLSHARAPVVLRNALVVVLTIGRVSPWLTAGRSGNCHRSESAEGGSRARRNRPLGAAKRTPDAPEHSVQCPCRSDAATATAVRRAGRGPRRRHQLSEPMFGSLFRRRHTPQRNLRPDDVRRMVRQFVDEWPPFRDRWGIANKIGPDRLELSLAGLKKEAVNRRVAGSSTSPARGARSVPRLRRLDRGPCVIAKQPAET